MVTCAPRSPRSTRDSHARWCVVHAAAIPSKRMSWRSSSLLIRSRVDGVSGATNTEQLTHLDAEGNAHMVDVGAKPITERVAIARALVRMSPATAAAVAAGDAPKGDVIGTARLAAIMAAKRTDELIPLAHTLGLTSVDVDIHVDADAGEISVTTTVRVSARTGVEMEAMVGASAGALCVYDMVKGIERGVVIERIELLEKRGGRSGVWRRDE